MDTRKNTISIAGIAWATEDFVLSEDITLENGTVLKKGKEYFTWDEATSLDLERKLPKGFRLPTWGELRAIYAYELTDGTLADVLSLQLCGHIAPEDMAEYNRDPEAFSRICDEAQHGLYWSSTECRYPDDPDNWAHVLYLLYDYATIHHIPMSIGCRIRCVAE